MITLESIRHKLYLLTDQMVDVAHDMQLVDNLEYLVKELLTTAESLSKVADALPKATPPKPYQIGCGDHVFHAPSLKTLVVREVRNDIVMTMEQPQTMLFLNHCLLIYKATDAERQALQQEQATNENAVLPAEAIQ